MFPALQDFGDRSAGGDELAQADEGGDGGGRIVGAAPPEELVMSGGLFHGVQLWVVLPEHMHCVWTLPPGDADYPLRWRLIKTFFCRGLPSDEYRSLTRLRRGERGIWQRRYWEHQLRDDEDFRRHIDYVYKIGRAHV
mgnify:CR=1 FL=1